MKQFNSSREEIYQVEKANAECVTGARIFFACLVGLAFAIAFVFIR